MSDLPLAGVRVLDLTQVLGGPYACMVLADLGADVIKVEPPGRGEQGRRAMGRRMRGSDSAAFLAVNRGKRSLTLDLKSDEGHALFGELVDTADAVVESMRPGVARRLRIDADSLRARRPELVCASLSGFGSTGPYADRPGYDLIAQAMTGLMSITGHPGQAPAKAGVPVADLCGGLFVALGVLAALLGRERQGSGRAVETSLYEAALALAVGEATSIWAGGATPAPLGSAHRLLAPYQALRTADGWVTVGANNDKLWRLLCATLDRPDLAADPRFADNDARMAQRDELVAELESALGAATTDECVERLLAAGVPAGPIRDYREVLDDPHTHARAMVVEAEHPVEGRVRMLGSPLKVDGAPLPLERSAPLLGAHTDELLDELGVSVARREALRAAGAV